MRMIMTLLLLMISINMLTACSGISSNVAPQKGPTMEQIYDSMKREKNVNTMVSTDHDTHVPPLSERSNLVSELPRNAVDAEFRKLANPELTMYVFPHVASKDEVPIPGYYTVFSAYEHDHYALRTDRVRG